MLSAPPQNSFFLPRACISNGELTFISFSNQVSHQSSTLLHPSEWKSKNTELLIMRLSFISASIYSWYKDSLRGVGSLNSSHICHIDKFQFPIETIVNEKENSNLDKPLGITAPAGVTMIKSITQARSLLSVENKSMRHRYCACVIRTGYTETFWWNKTLEVRMRASSQPTNPTTCPHVVGQSDLPCLECFVSR